MLFDLFLKINEIKELNIYMYGFIDSFSKFMVIYRKWIEFCIFICFKIKKKLEMKLMLYGDEKIKKLCIYIF